MATAKVSCVALIHGHKLLIGKRNDDGRWNLPGGHHEKGETPAEACSRECKEETGIWIDPDDLIFLGTRKVTKKSGKKCKVYAFKFEVDKTKEVKGKDTEEEHDWTWVDTRNGLPKEVIKHWHNQDDVVLNYLGLMGRNEDIPNDDLIEKSVAEAFEKAWPKDYHRVAGQDKDKGVSSKKQKRFMHAVASGKVSGHAPSPQEAKDYISNSGDNLPESGTDGARGKREKERGERKQKKHHKKGKDKDTSDVENTKKADEAKDNYSEHVVGEHIKRQNRPKVATFADQVARIKDKYSQKKPKSFEEQVASVKAKYKTPIQKCADAFYAKIEACLEKSGVSEAVLDVLLDADLACQGADEHLAMNLYKTADKLFDAALTAEEQVVAELGYLAKSGDDDALEQLELFTVQMYDELLKHSTVDGVIVDLVKDKYAQYKEARPMTVADEHEAKELAAQRKKAEDDRHRLTPDIDPSTDGVLKSSDNSRVVGKKNGASVRRVHGYLRYTSGPKRGDYVHRHEKEKKLGRKLKSTEEVNHKRGDRSGKSGTEVLSAGKHAAKTNHDRANGKGYSGAKRYEHSRD